MKTTDISDLMKGLLVIIGLAISMGRYEEIKRFARSQAVEFFSNLLRDRRNRYGNIFNVYSLAKHMRCNLPVLSLTMKGTIIEEKFNI